MRIQAEAFAHPPPDPSPVAPTEIETPRETAFLTTCALLQTVSLVPKGFEDPELDELVSSIKRGEDPLGRMLIDLRPAHERRSIGATYTPPAIVSSMVARAALAFGDRSPSRIVDPGCGSGRFLFEAARRWPTARLVAVETDPMAIMALKATADVLGLRDRLELLRESFLETVLDKAEGPTLFIGNPPYVRHHDITEADKTWLRRSLDARGVSSAGLAGLHVYFFVKTLELASQGDVGLFITPSEWLDVGYGQALRELASGALGVEEIAVFPAQVGVFEGTATTSATTLFQPGEEPAGIRFRRPQGPADLAPASHPTDRAVPAETLQVVKRWGGFAQVAAPSVIRVDFGLKPLGDYFRVSRGQVTGANRIWVAPRGAPKMPERLTVPVVSRAAELFAAAENGGALRDATKLKRAVNLPVSLSSLTDHEKKKARAFLKWAEAEGGQHGYIVENRTVWWSVGFRDPAPIVCTYMARRAPAFVRNLCGARIVNIAHGLYPREEMSPDELDAIAAWLSRSVALNEGRTYAGGLVKFEPREVEAILIPNPSELVEDRLVG